jgi:hypothetical protein
MSSINGVRETRAQAYGRALEVWGQWLRHWRRTGAPRALHATLICKQIAAEKFAAWRAELRADRSARHAMRAARNELALDQMLAQIRRDEQALDHAQQHALAPEAIRWRGIAVDEPAETLVAGPMVMPCNHWATQSGAYHGR